MMRPVVDIAPAGFDPLLSFKKSEWEAYQQYVAGLETQLAAHEKASEARVLKDAERKSDAAEEKRRKKADAAAEKRREEERIARRAERKRILESVAYTLGWAFFAVQMIPSVLTTVTFVFNRLGASAVGGFLAGGVILVAIALAVMVVFQLRPRNRPVAFFLVGVLSPLPFLMLIPYMTSNW